MIFKDKEPTFKEITENSITMDFSNANIKNRRCKTPKDIHTLFKNKFAFPDYY